MILYIWKLRSNGSFDEVAVIDDASSVIWVERHTDTGEFEVVAINDLASAQNLAYLLKYDSAQKVFKNHTIEADEKNIIFDGRKIPVIGEQKAEWKRAEIRRKMRMKLKEEIEDSKVKKMLEYILKLEGQKLLL